MITEQDFIALLDQVENETLDFKASNTYDLSNESSKASLIKDILCMANTPRDRPSHIILGVKKFPNGTYELWGESNHPDDADMQSQFSERVYPIPEFSYEVLSHAGKKFGVITVQPRKIGPCVPLKDFGNVLRQRQVYFRRSSKNDVATPEDLKRILEWISSSDRDRANEYTKESQPWNDLLEAVHSFSPSRHYLLLAGPLSDETTKCGAIGDLPWMGVFDFDPDSDSTGLLSAVRATIETHRSLHLIVSGDRPLLNPERATYWFFARGITGRGQTLKTGPWPEWIRSYGNELNEQVRRLSAAVNPSPITCVALWYETDLIQHLRSSLSAVLGAFGNSVELVIVTEDPAKLQSVAAEFDASLIGIPLNHLCSGIQIHVSGSKPTEQDYDLPSSSDAPIRLDESERRWLEEELEIVHKNVGFFPPAERSIGEDFLRGNEITWYELGLHYDVDRELTAKVQDRVLEPELTHKRTVRVNLYHAPGAGGTTVARRLLWQFHKKYPCAILFHCDPPSTAERLYRLSSLTERAVLLLIDGAQITERQVDELYDHLRSRKVPVVLLQTLRRFTKPGPSKDRFRTFYLDSELTGPEPQWFLERFSQIKPLKRSSLERLVASPEPKKHTAFYFGLETFGPDFLGLEPYVSARLSRLSPIQKRILIFLSIAHHYAQHPIRAQAFVDLLGIPRSRPVALEKSLSEESLDLLVEVQDGTWRTAHDIIAQEILQQLLSPSTTDRRLWRQNLSTWAIEFAKFCRGIDAVASEEMLEIARRTFIYRDNIDLLGTERSASQSFAQLLEEIPSPEGRLGVLQALVEMYPEEAHFWSHLGRYYSIKLRDFERALTCSEHAIALQSDDHVLHHMHGMTLRYKIYQRIGEQVPLAEVVEIASLASASFERARELDPDDEHGYISEVQMLVRVLDYAGRVNGSGPLNYLSLPSSDPFLRESIERAEGLLEQVRRNREGEKPSPYEEDSRGKLDALYGHHDKALEIWNNLLSRPDAFRPPLRRQIVWTYLARRDRSWDKLDVREIERIVDLLQENLEEEQTNEKNLRLWVQAVRRLKNPPSIESVIERIGYWRANSGALDAVYYLYVFYSLLALEGSSVAQEEAKRHIEECRQMARLRRNRTKSFEWLGIGAGLKALIHHTDLGEWSPDRIKDFWEDTRRLARVKGRITKIHSPQAGEIEVECGSSTGRPINYGLPAFYVPAKSGHVVGRAENRSVDFYLSFRYDGLQAWEVRYV